MTLVTDEQFLDVIKKHQSENLTVRRLVELTGYYSTSSVHERLKRMEKAGQIKRKRLTVIEVTLCP